MGWHWFGALVMFGFAASFIWTGVDAGLRKQDMALGWFQEDEHTIYLTGRDAVWVGWVHIVLGLGGAVYGIAIVWAALTGVDIVQWDTGIGILVIFGGQGLFCLGGAILMLFGIVSRRWGALALGTAVFLIPAAGFVAMLARAI